MPSAQAYQLYTSANMANTYFDFDAASAYNNGTTYIQADLSTAPMTIEEMNCHLMQLALDSRPNRDYSAPQYSYTYGEAEAFGTKDASILNLSENDNSFDVSQTYSMTGSDTESLSSSSTVSSPLHPEICLPVCTFEISSQYTSRLHTQLPAQPESTSFCMPTDILLGPPEPLVCARPTLPTTPRRSSRLKATITYPDESSPSDGTEIGEYREKEEPYRAPPKQKKYKPSKKIAVALHRVDEPIQKKRKPRKRQASYGKRVYCPLPHCGGSYTRPADCRRHLRTVHNQHTKAELYDETRPKYRRWCLGCNEMLSRPDARRRHEQGCSHYLWGVPL